MKFLILVLFATISIEAKRFFIPNFKANWYKAQEICISLEMELASVESQAKHDAIVKFAETTDKFTNGTRFWLGASDLAEEGSFVWLTNSRKLTFTRWAGNEPNNGENEHCVEIIYNFFVNQFWQWNDQDCRGFNAYFICENREGCTDPVVESEIAPFK